ncbi:hypothetical protein AAMO2058_000602600 [Amorphochlora amoebiformis]
MNELKKDENQFKNKIVVDGETYTPTIKAYKNFDFLMSGGARPIRILCEYYEPLTRLETLGIEATILFFASARAHSPEKHAKVVAQTEKDLAAAKEGTPEHTKVKADLLRLQRLKWMCQFHKPIRELAKKLSEWGVKRAAQDLKKVSVCSGGGPGLMEAANKGASEVKGSGSVGMGISVPYQKGLNPGVTNDLGFLFHYFFTRKYWMANICHGLVAFPGGFGTMDELFEIMTLVQTGKHPDIPFVLFGKKFWNTVVNWDCLVEMGTVSPRDVERLYITDDVEDAFKYITSYIVRR